MSAKGGKTLVVRAFVGAVAAAAVLSLTVVEAFAEPAFCDELRAEYASASRAAVRGGGSADAAALRRQLGAAQAQARRLNCNRFLFGPRPSSKCPAVTAQINRLTRQLNQATGFGWDFFDRRQQASYDRDRIRGSLARNGCYLPSTTNGTGGSGYRTLCVRTCDGYYFPISSSTSQNRFKIDDSVCRNLYGGSPAEVYIQHNSAPIESARSLTGQPYTNLSTALAYRQTFNPTCQAELHNGLKAIAAAQEVAVAHLEAVQRTDPASLLPTPTVRVEGDEDPETLNNIAGNFHVEPVAPPEDTESDIGAMADVGNHMRQIGPSYYYADPVVVDALKRRPAPAIDIGIMGTAHADERPAAAPSAAPVSVQ